LSKENGVSERGYAYSDPGDVEDTVADLKEDVTALSEELEGAASEAMRRTLRSIEDTVADLYETVAEQSSRGVEAIERQVDERPWTSLAVAFGLGCVIGLIVSRER
jgi:ElaB/YqjD/DUF883 family membrane-anchored ribosome-binding protein